MLVRYPAGKHMTPPAPQRPPKPVLLSTLHLVLSCDPAQQWDWTPNSLRSVCLQLSGPCWYVVAQTSRCTSNTHIHQDRQDQTKAASSSNKHTGLQSSSRSTRGSSGITTTLCHQLYCTDWKGASSEVSSTAPSSARTAERARYSDRQPDKACSGSAMI